MSRRQVHDPRHQICNECPTEQRSIPAFERWNTTKSTIALTRAKMCKKGGKKGANEKKRAREKSTNVAPPIRALLCGRADCGFNGAVMKSDFSLYQQTTLH